MNYVFLIHVHIGHTISNFQKNPVAFVNSRGPTGLFSFPTSFSPWPQLPLSGQSQSELPPPTLSASRTTVLLDPASGPPLIPIIAACAGGGFALAAGGLWYGCRHRRRTNVGAAAGSSLAPVEAPKAGTEVRRPRSFRPQNLVSAVRGLASLQ